ncbi:Tigger transposable element-derived protein 6 [Frankliniella fusca]|uniref:Tigger transposable element-derived protein 6 n=1 Tax=Frankliniella fusca TaxID=407009 RepID=A0AAE1I3B2_9NEOP|nr:Tigger transposable element-derived protein 6 [Frankliniella fusca]
MVRTYKKKTDRQPISPSKLMKAVKLVEEGWALRAAARQCNVKKSNLWDLLKKVKKSGIDISTAPKKAFKQKAGPKGIFDETQEKTIVNYCVLMCKMGYGLTVDKLRELAYEVAVANNIECPAKWHVNKMAGIDWYHGFKKRHSDELSIRTPEACSIARAMAFNKRNVDNYFDKLQEVLCRHECFRDGSRVYNLDETSTSTEQNSRKLISPKGCKQVHQVKTAERGISVTTSVIIGAHGLANEKGYNTKETFIDSMNHFIKCTNSSQDNPTLLLLDNVDTHFSTVVLDLAKDNGVTIFTFPPHCTHKLQPLDVGFFGPFKSYYDKAIHSFILSNPGVSITIYHLAGFVRDALCKAAIPSTIINSFQKAGICPFNRDIFQECDFIMATVTHQPNPADPPQVEEKNIPQDDNAHTHNNDNVSDNFVTPESLKGLPHAKPTNPTRKPRRKGKCMVATDTPEKVLISQREKQVKEKKEKAEERKRKRTKAKENEEKGKQKKVNKKKKNTIARTIVFETTDEENEDSDLDDPPEEVENVTANAKILLPSEGDYVLVNFKIGKDGKHYVGKIIQEKDEDDDLQISYMRRVLDSNPPQFVMPNIPDLNSVHFSDIIAILPKPSYPKKATRRQQSVISFDFNFGTVNLC